MTTTTQTTSPHGLARQLRAGLEVARPLLREDNADQVLDYLANQAARCGRDYRQARETVTSRSYALQSTADRVLQKLENGYRLDRFGELQSLGVDFDRAVTEYEAAQDEIVHHGDAIWSLLGKRDDVREAVEAWTAAVFAP